MENILFVVAVIMWLLLLCIFLKYHVRLNFKKSSVTELAKYYMTKFKVSDAIAKKITFADLFLKAFSFKDFDRLNGLATSLDLSQDESKAVEDVTAGKLWFTSDTKLSFRLQLTQFLVSFVDILKSYAKIIDDTFILQVISGVFILYAGVTIFATKAVFLPVLSLILALICMIADIAMLVVNQKRNKKLLDKAEQMGKPLYLSNYLLIPEIQQYIVSYLTTEKNISKLTLSQHTDQVTKLMQKLTYGYTLIYLMIILDNVRMANAATKEISTIPNSLTLNTHLDIDIRRAIITVSQSLQDDNYLKSLAELSKTDANAFKDLLDNINQINQFLFTELKNVLSDYLALQDQILNNMPSKDKQAEILQYYKNFDRAGKALTTGNVSSIIDFAKKPQKKQ